MNKFFKVLSVSCLSLLMGMMMIVPQVMPISAQEGEGVHGCTYWYAGPYRSEAHCDRVQRLALSNASEFIRARDKCLLKMGNAAFWAYQKEGALGAFIKAGSEGAKCIISQL